MQVKHDWSGAEIRIQEAMQSRAKLSCKRNSLRRRFFGDDDGGGAQQTFA
jgi:hypothetical protein